MTTPLKRTVFLSHIETVGLGGVNRRGKKGELKADTSNPLIFNGHNEIWYKMSGDIPLRWACKSIQVGEFNIPVAAFDR
jgi:hypothetical protein